MASKSKATDADVTAPVTAQDGPQEPGSPEDVAQDAIITLGPDERIDAPTLAALMRDPLGSHQWALGRKVTDKRVRSVARDTIDRFVNRTGYTAHAYTAAEADALHAAMVGRGRGATGPTADALRARTGKVPA